eukprot:5823628-Prymnesium_polylepis.1
MGWGAAARARAASRAAGGGTTTPPPPVAEGASSSGGDDDGGRLLSLCAASADVGSSTCTPTSPTSLAALFSLPTSAECASALSESDSMDTLPTVVVDGLVGGTLSSALAAAEATACSVSTSWAFSLFPLSSDCAHRKYPHPNEGGGQWAQRP